MKRLLILMLLVMIIPALASAYEVNKDVTVRINSNDATSCNLTSFAYPNATTIVEDVAMTKRGTEFSTLILSGNISVSGDYEARTACTDGTDTVTKGFIVPVSPLGDEQTTAESIISGVSLFAIILFGITTLVLGLVLLRGDSYWYFGAISLGIGVVLIILAASTVAVYMQNVAYNTGVEGSESLRYISRGVGVAAWLLIPFMLLYAGKKFKEKNERRKQNDGWDNNEY